MYLALVLPTSLAGLCKATLSADITFIDPEQLFKDGEGEDCQCGSQDYKYQFDLGGKLMQTNGQDKNCNKYYGLDSYHGLHEHHDLRDTGISQQRNT